MPRIPKPPKTPKLAEAEAVALSCIRKRDYAGAIRAVAAYEARQPIARGIGVDWANPNVSGGKVALEWIRNARAEATEEIREAAAMMYLWGMSKPYRRWLPAEAKGDAAAAALVSEAYEAQQEKAFLYIRDSLMVTPPRVAELLDRVAKRRDAT